MHFSKEAPWRSRSTSRVDPVPSEAASVGSGTCWQQRPNNKEVIEASGTLPAAEPQLQQGLLECRPNEAGVVNQPFDTVSTEPGDRPAVALSPEEEPRWSSRTAEAAEGIRFEARDRQ